jgi:hypothetical protein
MIQTTLGGLKFPDGSLQTTAAVTGLQSVIHNATLQGQGTQGSPLGVAIPLSLTGAGAEILSVQNNSVGGGGIVITAGDGNSSDGGGDGIVTSGGDASASEAGGGGVRASGGTADRGTGGTGVRGFGGDSASGFGGLGVEARAGSSLDGEGGVALSAIGGSGRRGGNGLFSVGGTGFGAGNSGGIGIVANAGVGLDGATPGLAGRFSGSVQITGSLSKGGGSFKIDHPLDPENKYLYHSFVESPDMMNIYNGNVVTDENGEAAITLPAYFEALNRDFRYQLTVIGTFAQAIVSDEVKGNRFIIRTSAPSVKVSWQVTGIRRDAWADKNRIPVEVEKDELERGHYLHPEAFSKPEEKGVEWARNPEMKKLQ